MSWWSKLDYGSPYHFLQWCLIICKSYRMLLLCIVIWTFSLWSTDTRGQNNSFSLTSKWRFEWCMWWCFNIHVDAWPQPCPFLTWLLLILQCFSPRQDHVLMPLPYVWQQSLLHILNSYTWKSVRNDSRTAFVLRNSEVLVPLIFYSFVVFPDSKLTLAIMVEVKFSYL